MNEIVIAKKKNHWVGGDAVPFISEITEADKPDFVELTDEALKHMFRDLEKPVTEEEELGAEYNFSEVYGADWYEARFPGFTPEEYWFMSKAGHEDNALKEKE